MGIFVVFLAFAFSNSPARGQQLLKTTFFPEPAAAPPVDGEPGQPTFLGKVFVQDNLGNWVPRKPLGRALQPFRSDRTLTVGSDVYVQDGQETSIAVNYDDGNNLIAAYNPYFAARLDIQPDDSLTKNFILAGSADGNLSWAAKTFPVGTFPLAGIDPWANAGNDAGEFFATFLTVPYAPPFFDSTHCTVSRSTDGGASFSLFFEKFKAVSQDKEEVDIDKTTARGGGAGSVHDGKVYLSYVDFGPPSSPGYKGSFLQVISANGAADIEIQVSGTGSPPFRGGAQQPVAGITDGTVYVMGTGFSGSNATAYFNEFTNGGAGPNTFSKSTLTFRTVGQPLPNGRPGGLNGFRTDLWGYLDIDRSSGPQRGYLFYISSRNPNPANTALDQGDVYLSVSTNGATNWFSAIIPAAAGETQYFPMMNVDEQGWIHVAYYQNETGSVNGGVLNASTANIYYTVSTDGGSSWTPPVQVNDPANAHDYEDPPPDRGASAYYLIGDYAQLAVTGTGASTKAYVLWTGYDKDRSDTLLGDMRARVLCTTVQSFPQCQNDLEAPVAMCQPDTILDAAAGQCSTVVNFGAVAQDNCPLGVAVVCNPPSGSTFPIGTDTVVCVATDLAANADTCSFAVTVSAVRGDMNATGDFSPADVVLLLNCVFAGTGNCGLCVADGNCSGDLSPADVVLELLAVFSLQPFPC